MTFLCDLIDLLCDFPCDLSYDLLCDLFSRANIYLYMIKGEHLSLDSQDHQVSYTNTEPFKVISRYVTRKCAIIIRPIK